MAEQTNTERSKAAGSPSYVDPRNGPDSLTGGPEFSPTFAEGLPGVILAGPRHATSWIGPRLGRRLAGADR